LVLGAADNHQRPRRIAHLSPFQDEELTDAEERVAAAVARGLSDKQIAAELGISARTVGNHVSYILAKKRFGNRVEIARHVFEQKRSG
jgi:DNA-binding NarL/FixJ family response regulator